MLESAKAELLWQYQLYQYALENGLGMKEQQYGELTEGWVAQAKQQKGYESAEQEYESCGTTLEAHIRQSAKTFWRISDTVYFMQYCFQEEFRNEGKDTVDGVAYDMAGNYANACMNRILLLGCGSVDTGEFEEELERAGQYWEEHDAPF